jgi:CubicO group peptidase (beta-lactamase class C family)
MNRYLVASVLGVAITACARAQTPGTTLPNTPAGVMVQAWLQAVNSGDTVLVREYARRYEAETPADTAQVSEVTAQILGFRQRTRGVTLAAIVEQRPELIVATLRTGDGRRLRLRYEVERGSDGAYRAALVGLRPEDEEAAASLPAGLGDAEIARLLDERLTRRAADGRFSGALLVAHDGRPVFSRAYGIADRRSNAPNTLDTKFTLASMGKMFTATAIAQLVEQGRVALDSPIAAYLPDYPNPTFARQATVRHLLSHRSGLGSYWNRLYDERRATLTTVASHFPLFVNDSIPFAPGTRFRYSNAGFQVLGRIIERVSGQSYYDYVRDHIFVPAGMVNTGYYAPNGEVEGGAVGHTRDGPDGAWRDNLGSREIKGGAAGGGYSTAGDLLRLAQALIGGRLIQPETLKLLTTPTSAADEYGLGFVTTTHHGHPSFGHSGGAPGMGTNLLIVPDLGYVAVILTNGDPPLMQPVGELVTEMVTNR